MSSTSSMNAQTPTIRSPPLPPPPPYSYNHDDDNNNNNDDDDFRDIHALTPTSHPVPSSRQRMFDANSRRSRSSNLSVASDITNSSENFTTMSREFNALVIAGSTIDHNDFSTNNNNHVSGNNGYGYGSGNGNNGNDRNNNNINLDRIGEEEGETEETNPLAIVPDINPMPSPPGGQGNMNDSSLGHLMGSSSRSTNNNSNSNSNSFYSNNNSGGEIAIHHVKKEEVETKIAAWQTAKISKINNRFKREDAIINGWENEQVHKATSWMKKIERKLEEKRAKAMEKTENNIAKARRKAEERRASAEGKRGTKVARVLEVANLMRAVGRPPAKRSFF